MIIWKIIENYPNYEVSNDGQVRNRRTKRVRKLYVYKGYKVLTVRISGTKKQAFLPVHRVMAETFIGPSKGRLVRHLNDVKSDNRLENLAYGTEADNAMDFLRNGRICAANKSGYRGVSWNTRDSNWKAQFQHRQTGRYLGRHATALEAAVAYDDYVEGLYGVRPNGTLTNLER